MKWNALHQLLVMTKYAIIGTILQTLFVSLLLADNTWAQKSIEDVYISARFKDASLAEVFRSVERQTDFRFVYKEEVRRQDMRITFHSNRLPLAELLRHIAQENHLRFQRVNDVISVIALPAESPSGQGVVEMPLVQIRVSGKVTSADDGMPLPGVNILIKGTTNGTKYSV